LPLPANPYGEAMTRAYRYRGFGLERFWHWRRSSAAIVPFEPAVGMRGAASKRGSALALKGRFDTHAHVTRIGLDA